MEKKIKEVQKYFKDKILKGEFEFVKASKFSVHIKVDSKYPFEIWTGSGPRWLAFEKTTSENFILLGNLTQEEQLCLWEHMKDYAKNWKKFEQERINRCIEDVHRRMEDLQKRLKEINDSKDSEDFEEIVNGTF